MYVSDKEREGDKVPYRAYLLSGTCSVCEKESMQGNRLLPVVASAVFSLSRLIRLISSFPTHQIDYQLPTP